MLGLGVVVVAGTECGVERASKRLSRYLTTLEKITKNAVEIHLHLFANMILLCCSYSYKIGTPKVNRIFKTELIIRE